MTGEEPKDLRFDRQLRLWSNHGQECLQNANLCFINSCGISTEILKNLVLPSIGSFTIIDSKTVSKSDLGSNFFVDIDSYGKPRATVVCENLLRLNPYVKGNYLIKDINMIIESEPSFLQQFDVIISTDPTESLTVKLKKLCRNMNIPFLVCYTIGMIGFLQVHIDEHTIIESHPDATIPDLRLDIPIPGMNELIHLEHNNFVKELTLSEKLTMTAHDFGHIPWLIIIKHALNKYYETHENKYPSNFKERKIIVEIIQNYQSSIIDLLKREDPEESRNLYELENFKEAISAVNTALNPTRIPDEVQEVLQASESINLSHLEDRQNKSPFQNPRLFWTLVKALKEFVDERGYLPLRGSIPDMASDTKRYLELQNLYKTVHEEHVNIIEEKSIKLGTKIDKAIVQIFVKNAFFIRLLRGDESETDLSPTKLQNLSLMPNSPENDSLYWYWTLKAALLFLEDHQRWPGCFKAYSNTSPGAMDAACSQALVKKSDDIQDLIQRDIALLSNYLGKFLRASPELSQNLCTNHIMEMVRFGGGEIHAISAFCGGIAAQEVIKLITHQFVPIFNKPLIYNGINQSVNTIDF